MATVIHCAAIDCEYNDGDSKCTADEIRLSAHYIMTTWGGRQHFDRCNEYNKSRQPDEFRIMLEQTKKGV